MICFKCKKEFPECEIQKSHDVPCYLFDGPSRKIKEQQADKYGTHMICKKCHDIYEKILFSYITRTVSIQQRLKFIEIANKFSKRYFNETTK